MRGVPEGRGESEYLQCKYSEMPTFHRKVGTPSDPVAPGFARIHRATSPINGGGKSFFDTLKRTNPCGSSVFHILIPQKYAGAYTTLHSLCYHDT